MIYFPAAMNAISTRLNSKPNEVRKEEGSEGPSCWCGRARVVPVPEWQHLSLEGGRRSNRVSHGHSQKLSLEPVP